MCHVYVRHDGLAAVLVSDVDYPNRVAHTLLTKVLDDVSTKCPDWKTMSSESFKNYKGWFTISDLKELKNYILKAQFIKEFVDSSQRWTCS